MDNQRKIALELELLEFLPGKLRLLQPVEQKIEVVEEALREFFKSEKASRFKREMEELDQTDRRGLFIKDFLTYNAIIRELMSDFNVEDIVINSLKSIYIHHSQRGLAPVGRQFDSDEELELFIRKLIVFSGRYEREPIMNVELSNLEGRVNIIDSPFGPQITITKAKASPLSILDLIKKGALSYEVAAQLWVYLEGMSIRPANLIIAGGPGVGKTTLLNSLFSFIPEKDRIVVMEDTLELNTDFEESCSRLESRDNLSLADLVKNSLRMRPERIVVGEVRGSEARDMITAANVGKYCIGTIHALTAREAIMRMQNEPMNIPRDMVRLMDVFVVLKRYHVGGKVTRVVDEVSETSGMEQEKILLSQIFKYDYESNTLKGMSTSTIFRDRLAQESGLLPKDIILEVQLRALLLKQLHERGHTTLKEVTAFCRAYNNDPDRAVESLGLSRGELLGEEYLRERRQRFLY
ncbi:MAG: ATPase, T2SS/T4P/T4SS family [Candidatus Omnitrophota bacterium]